MAQKKKPTDGTGVERVADAAPPSTAISDEVVKTVAKKRGALPTEQDPELVQKGDNAKYLNYSLTIAMWDDVDWTNAQSIEDRVMKYFNYCVSVDLKPSVTGLALALGIDRRRLWEIANDRHTQGDKYIVGSVIVKKAYKILENQWSDFMLNGKINPASGIFLGKNYYGYTDEQKITVKPDNPLGDAESAESVRQKYLEEGDTDD